MIKIDKVDFEYNKDKVILRNASAVFEEGKMYSIVGPSGVGKSTLLSIIAGLEKANYGKVYFDDTESDYTDVIRKHNISLIFQNFLLFPYMTAVQNVVTAMDIQNKDGNSHKEKAEKILLNLGLTTKDIHRPVKKLSGGEQQRVAIARAISVNTKYILADEPTGNLDEDNAELIIDILKKLAHENNCVVIIVTHSEYVKNQSDVSLTLSRGSLMVQ